MTTTSVYPWNTTRAMTEREVIIEKKFEPSTEQLAKMIACSKREMKEEIKHYIHCLMKQQKEQSTHILKRLHHTEKQNRENFRKMEFLEILNKRRGIGRNNDAALALLATDNCDDNNGLSTALAVTLLDRDDDRRHHHHQEDHRPRPREDAIVDLLREMNHKVDAMQREIVQVQKDIVQIDTIIGINPPPGRPTNNTPSA